MEFVVAVAVAVAVAFVGASGVAAAFSAARNVTAGIFFHDCK